MRSCIPVVGADDSPASALMRLLLEEFERFPDLVVEGCGGHLVLFRPTKILEPAAFPRFQVRCARWRVFSRVKCRFLDGHQLLVVRSKTRRRELAFVLLSTFRFQFLATRVKAVSAAPSGSGFQSFSYQFFPSHPDKAVCRAAKQWIQPQFRLRGGRMMRRPQPSIMATLCKV